MQDKELWKTFEKTGSVVDYLSYRGACGGNHENYGGFQTGEKADLGEETLESEGNSDRDDIVRSTYR